MAKTLEQRTQELQHMIEKVRGKYQPGSYGRSVYLHAQAQPGIFRLQYSEDDLQEQESWVTIVAEINVTKEIISIIPAEPDDRLVDHVITLYSSKNKPLMLELPQNFPSFSFLDETEDIAHRFPNGIVPYNPKARIMIRR